jgi:hypothetical protein
MAGPGAAVKLKQIVYTADEDNLKVEQFAHCNFYGVWWTDCKSYLTEMKGHKLIHHIVPIFISYSQCDEAVFIY